MPLRHFASFLWIPVFALLVWGIAPSAHAQDPNAEARALFDAGSSAFAAGRFDEAYDYFVRSYELSHAPILHFNIASAADRLGRYQAAIDSYQAYLDSVPDAQNRAFVESRIQLLREQAANVGGDDGPIIVLGIGAAAFGIVTISSAIWMATRIDAVNTCSDAESRGITCVNAPTLTTERDASMGTLVIAGVLALAAGATLIALLTTADSGDASAGCGPAQDGFYCYGGARF
jgi:tetratricopeptide (TPR) repeat protein